MKYTKLIINKNKTSFSKKIKEKLNKKHFYAKARNTYNIILFF